MAQGKISAKQQEILDYIKSQILERGFPPAVRDICEAVHLKSTSSVHSHLESLEANGYIRREVCREDRRNTYVTLTAAGETEVQRANQLLEEFHRGIQKRFTQEESDQLMELLRRLYMAASEELDEMKGEKQANG